MSKTIDKKQVRAIHKVIAACMYLLNEWKDAVQGTGFGRFKIVQLANNLLKECEKVEKVMTEANKSHDFWKEAMDQMHYTATVFGNVLDAVSDCWQPYRQQMSNSIQSEVKRFIDSVNEREYELNKHDKVFIDKLEDLLNESNKQVDLYNTEIAEMQKHLDKRLEKITDRYKLANPDLKS